MMVNDGFKNESLLIFFFIFCECKIIDIAVLDNTY